jgi:hypothetical protein
VVWCLQWRSSDSSAVEEAQLPRLVFQRFIRDKTVRLKPRQSGAFDIGFLVVDEETAFGRETLVAMGIDAGRAEIVEDFIRTRDHERLAVQQAEGIYAGIDLLRTRPTPTPLSQVQRGARALNQEAGELITGAEDEVEG